MIAVEVIFISNPLVGLLRNYGGDDIKDYDEFVASFQDPSPYNTNLCSLILI